MSEKKNSLGNFYSMDEKGYLFVSITLMRMFGPLEALILTILYEFYKLAKAEDKVCEDYFLVDIEKIYSLTHIYHKLIAEGINNMVSEGFISVSKTKTNGIYRVKIYVDSLVDFSIGFEQKRFLDDENYLKMIEQNRPTRDYGIETSNLNEIPFAEFFSKFKKLFKDKI